MDKQLMWLMAGTVGMLSLASAIGWVLGLRAAGDAMQATVANLKARINAWWVMVALLVGMVLLGRMGSVILFGGISFLALREMITLTPTHKADHRTLFWAFFIITPLQYYLVAIEWYGLFTVLIPVYAFLFIPVRSAVAGDSSDFLGRIAKIQWGLMVCVYCLSHVPAILMLQIPGFSHEGQNARLLLFLVIIVEMSDVLQYVFGKTLGRHKIAPEISPNKTWEGFIGGILSVSLLGAGLCWMTPFSRPQAAGLALILALLGFAGGLTMSAIKRDSGIKDFGNLIPGHGGVMDRVDSLCFAAPVYFHLVRFFAG